MGEKEQIPAVLRKIGMLLSTLVAADKQRLGGPWGAGAGNCLITYRGPHRLFLRYKTMVTTQQIAMMRTTVHSSIFNILVPERCDRHRAVMVPKQVAAAPKSLDKRLENDVDSPRVGGQHTQSLDPEIVRQP